jgi:hypothetical protein
MKFTGFFNGLLKPARWTDQTTIRDGSLDGKPATRLKMAGLIFGK